MLIKTKLLLLLILMACSAKAQPVLTRENIAPVPGDSAVTKSYEFIAMPEGGEAVVWDYTSAAPATRPMQYGWYSDTAHARFKPTASPANIALNRSSYSTFQYLTNDYWLRTGGMEVYGSDTTHTLFYNPDTVLVFPLEYGDSFRNHHTALLAHPGMSELKTQADTSVADGWGTLIMPDGTVYNDVLRLKTRTSLRYEDSTGYMLQHTIITLSYYKPGFHGPLLQHKDWHYKAGTSPTVWNISNIETQAYYTSLALPKTESPMAGFALYPNPATDQFTIRLPDGHIVITDLHGRIIHRAEVLQQATIDASRWPAGLYLIRATGPDGTTGCARICLQ